MPKNKEKPEESQSLQISEDEGDANASSDAMDPEAVRTALSANFYGRTKEQATNEIQRLNGLSEEEAKKVAEKVFEENEEDAGKGGDQRALKKKLLEAARERFHLFPDDHDDAFAVRKGESLAVPIESTPFRNELKLIANNEYGEIPSEDQIKPAIELLAAFASQEERRTVHRRYSYEDGKLFIDRGDKEGTVLLITSKGTGIPADPPPFHRPQGMKEIPEPASEGDISLLRKHLNYRHEADLWLIVAWALAAMRPDLPCPTLVFQGEQGTGKSTNSKMLRWVVDPRDNLIASAPRTIEDLYPNARSWRVLCYDNLSGISPRLADDFCGLSTGTGITHRKQYSNFDEATFKAKRALIFNGIDALATRGDLQSRSIILQLPVIQDGARKSEAETWASFMEDAPKIVRALYDAASYGIGHPVGFGQKPRMADFTEWAASCLQYFGIQREDFRAYFTDNQEGSVKTILETDPAASLIMELIDYEGGEFRGTASELAGQLKDFGARHGIQTKEIPTTRKVRDRLKRLAPALRTEGIHWEDLERDGQKRPLRIYRRTDDNDDGDDATGRMEGSGSGPGDSAQNSREEELPGENGPTEGMPF